jgi:hypothetical protein
MSGNLYTTSLEDHRIDFLKLYHNLFRGSVLQKYNMYLNFTIKHTFMKLAILNLTLNTTSQIEDMTPFSLTAVGYNYVIPYIGMGV